MRSSCLRLLMGCLALVLTGCSGSVLPGHIDVLITNTFPDSSIQAGAASVTLSAEVTNDPHRHGVAWSLTLANVPCSPACGTLVPSTAPSFSAVYSPPSKAPSNQQATITASAVDSPTSVDVLLFTIIPTTTVSITNKFTSVVATSPAIVVNANVENDLTNSGVNWTLTAGGSNCSPACGTLAPASAPSFEALYTPPATEPTGASANPTITATSLQNSSASDNFSFAINSPFSLVNGSYVFLLRGYDIFSGPMAMAGVITADGQGNMTTGEIDFDNGGGITHVAPPATGTYTVDLSFNGITRVGVEISSFTFPNSTTDLKFRFVLSQDGTRGHIIELDGSGYINSGTIEPQDSTAISSAPSGNFAFGLDSDAPVSGRIVAAGQLQFGASGITGGLIDQSKAADATPTYSATALSPSAVSAPDSNGRGTLSITAGGVTSQYAYYIVDSSHLRLVEIDPGLAFGAVQAGTAIRQNNLSASSINATSVIQLTGMDVFAGTDTPGPDVIIGVMTVSNGAFNLTFDSNDLGATVTSNPGSGSITSFDPNSGRAVLSSPSGFQQGFVDSAVIYLYDQGAGFVIDADPSTPNGTPPDQAVTNNAFSGTLTMQAAGPFTNGSVSGNLIAGFGASAASNIPNWDLAFTVDTSNGSYSAEGDLTSLPSQDGNAINGQISGTYPGLVSKALGHGRLTVPATVFGDFTSGNTVTASFYLIAPNQFVLIGVTGGEYSGVAFVDPD